MSDDEFDHIPTEIKLHQRTRNLEVTFNDGSNAMLSSEYLRVYSPAAENRVDLDRGVMATGKENVAITKVTPVGNHAIRLTFSDGHKDGVYSWRNLYELSRKHETNWEAYLKWLEDKRLGRSTEGGGKIRLVFFAKLVDRLGRVSEEADIPGSVSDVGALLAWLRRRGGDWDTYLKDEAVRVTVNREFATLDSALAPGDEVAIVPSHPH